MKTPNILYFRSVSKTLEFPTMEIDRVKPNLNRLIIVDADSMLHKTLIEQITNPNQYDIIHAKDEVNYLMQQLAALPNSKLPYAIICEYRYFFELGGYQLALMLKEQQRLKQIPFIVVARPVEVIDEIEMGARLKQTGVVDDFYIMPFAWELLSNRIDYLSRFKAGTIVLETKEENQYPLSMPLSKRLFDIIFASLALLFIAPIMILIAIAIKLESKGPVLYKSKRVGEGYFIFDFYKFRSMSHTADKELSKLTHLNQYGNDSKEGKEGVSFVKINNDPRVTKVGWFIRKTSLDELPQLINVLKGDMSIVGNRPLPLYEAQQLTRDVWAKRFLAPAGITGLWQVTKRGHSNMSAEERIELDNTYAQNCSFLMDMSIILRTLPAMLQREAV